MYIDTHFPPAGDRVARFLRLVDAFDRDEIEAAVERLIAKLDATDGDADVELNGDENDDPGDLRDNSWLEWTSLGRHKWQTANFQLLEDDEEADPGEDDDPAEESDSDRCPAGEDHLIGGPAIRLEDWRGRHIGSEDDAEYDYRSARAVVSTAF